MKKSALFLIVTMLIALFASCSTQKLTIRTNYVADTIRYTYTKDTTQIPVEKEIYNTSKIKDISYFEMPDNSIEASLLLEDGHTVSVSVTNGILNGNPIGRNYTYKSNYKQTEYINRGYIKTTEWIRNGNTDSVAIENVMSVNQLNKISTPIYTNIEKTDIVRYGSVELMETVCVDTTIYTRTYSEWFDNEIEKNGSVTFYNFPQKDDNVCKNIICVGKTYSYPPSNIIIYYLIVKCTDNGKKYWIKIDKKGWNMAKESEQLPYECLRHFNSDNKIEIEIITE